MPRQRRQFDDAQLARLASARDRVEAGTFASASVARGKANMFLDGNPIVYAGALEKVTGKNGGTSDVRTGDWVCVTDHAMAPICFGFYNETSSYAVRALAQAWESCAENAEDADGIVRARVREAYDARERLGLTSNARTTCYRLINSEGDRLSGLNVDVYGDVVVASSTAAWVEQRREVIVRALGEVLGGGGGANVVWRRDEKMYEAEGMAWSGESVSYYDAATGAAATGTIPSEVIVLENDVKYAVDMAGGHKTGFYVDQRENRLAMREMSRGKKVLDVCCYTGGFAINAALGGASSVTAVDSSDAALTVAARNAELNDVQDKVRFVRADAFDFMQRELDDSAAGTYDVVVLDPPKFAPSKPSLKKALPKYIGLNKRAMALLRPGGILVTCSCSGAVTQERLLPDVVAAAASAAGRRATLLASRGAGPDQPIDPAYSFGEYLTVLTVRVS